MLGKRDGSGLLRRTRNCQRGSGARTLEGHASALEKIINHPSCGPRVQTGAAYSVETFDVPLFDCIVPI